MSATVNPTIFKFLTDLEENNTRVWFADNKDYYLKEEEKIKEFFTAINEKLSAIDNISGMKAYRIYRDIRFSKDKTPYKTYSLINIDCLAILFIKICACTLYPK